MEAARDPWRPFRRTGWAALVLGTADLLGFQSPDVLQILGFPGLCLAAISGWSLLRRRPSALVWTAVAGGVTLADTLVTLVIAGPLLFRMLFADHGDPDAVHAFVLRHFLLFALRLAFWPFASALVMRDLRKRGLAGAYGEHTRDTVIGSFWVSAWISGVIQLTLQASLFRWV